jgi:hypothetical protein
MKEERTESRSAFKASAILNVGSSARTARGHRTSKSHDSPLRVDSGHFLAGTKRQGFITSQARNDKAPVVRGPGRKPDAYEAARPFTATSGHVWPIRRCPCGGPAALFVVGLCLNRIGMLRPNL